MRKKKEENKRENLIQPKVKKGNNIHKNGKIKPNFENLGSRNSDISIIGFDTELGALHDTSSKK